MKIVNVESFLRFWSHYNTLIIEVLIGLILLMVVYLAFRSFFGEEEEPVRVTGPAPRGGDQKSAPIAPAPNPAPPSSEAAPAPDAAQEQNIKELQTKLTEAEKRLAETLGSLNALKEEAEAKAKAEPLQAAAPVAPSSELEEKIKSLEARLAEYEIIAEDIADLSFYKEENTKLQRELESLRGSPAGGQVPPAEAAPVSTEPAPLPPAQEPAPEEAVASPTEAAPLTGPEPAAKAEETPRTGDKPLSEADDAELMDKFQNFVKKG